MKRNMLFGIYIALSVVFMPAVVLAAGAHDGLSCTGCHALHTAKETALIFAVEPNKKDVNLRTKQIFSGTTALCLGCHETSERGGQGIKPIDAHMSHPYGLKSVNPKVARVPEDLLRDGHFECVSCHDPHPSNTNYKYLRIETAKGSKMEVFCAACHPMKADPTTASEKTRVFSSMDERGYGTVSAEGTATRSTEGRQARKTQHAAKTKTGQ